MVVSLSADESKGFVMGSDGCPYRVCFCHTHLRKSIGKSLDWHCGLVVHLGKIELFGGWVANWDVDWEFAMWLHLTGGPFTELVQHVVLNGLKIFRLFYGCELSLTKLYSPSWDDLPLSRNQLPDIMPNWASRVPPKWFFVAISVPVTVSILKLKQLQLQLQLQTKLFIHSCYCS